MGTRKAIRGVLSPFLGTFTSRYTEFDGYWLFGFLVSDLAELRIDLLATNASETHSPPGVAVQLAAAKFKDQVRKAGLACSQVWEAWLTIQKLPGSVGGMVNGHPCVGNNVSFLVEAVMEGGRRYQRKQIAFVAPHNVKLEFRSARTG